MPAINQANWTAVSLPHSDYYPVLMLICYFRIFFSFEHAEFCLFEPSKIKGF